MTEQQPAPSLWEFRLSPDRLDFAVYDPDKGRWFVPNAPMRGQWVDRVDMDRMSWTRYAPAVAPSAPADRAAILREAAGALLAADAEARKEGALAWTLPEAAALLRRMADEAQQPETQADQAHPAEHTWAAELHDPLADEWVPGTRYLVRDRAVNALAHARTVGPTWRDGTPTRRRLVRATTTYTVEAEPAAVSQPGKEA
jgi:hypothetical protein